MSRLQLQVTRCGPVAHHYRPFPARGGRGRALARAQSLPTSRQGPRLTFGCIRTRDGEIVPGSPPHAIAAAEFVDLVRRRRERPENSVGNFAAGERQKQQRQQQIESSIGHSSPGVDMLGR